MVADPCACFTAYDIRGRVPQELTLELVRHLGLAFAATFSPATVCVGHDMRLSSRDIFLVLSNALEDAGVNVVDLGLCGTEEVYHATFSQGFDGGIMITASHNPADWNGMKIVRKNAQPVSGDTGLEAIKALIRTGEFPLAQRQGVTRKQNFRAEYIQHLLSYLGERGANGLAPLTIVANAGNGCAWLPLHELAPHLPCTLVPVYPEPDGTFPNGVPNPLLPERREATRQAVLQHKAALGLAWDGDFDRCFFFDEQGEFIEGYYIVGLLAEALLRLHPGEKIIHDPRLTWNTREMVLAAGGTPIESKTGHAFIKERMRAENALYGGEMSAHHYFRDFAYCDSGMIVWLLIYQLMSETGKPLSALVQERMKRFPASGEINRTIHNPVAALQRLEAQYAPAAERVSHTDGLSVECADWRFNVRTSNTEPLMRLNVESRGDVALMQAKTKEILALLEATDEAHA